MMPREVRLHLIKLVYEYATLKSQPPGSLRDKRLAQLAVALGQRRLRVDLPAALIYQGRREAAVALTLDRDGLLLATAAKIPTGSTVIVRLGEPGQTVYAFPCEVEGFGRAGMSLRFFGVPLELHLGSRRTALRPLGVSA